jgi:hypothetical protein
MKKLTLTLLAAAALAIIPTVLCAQESNSNTITSRRIGQWVISREYSTISNDDGKDEYSVSYGITSFHDFEPHLPLFSVGFSRFVIPPFALPPTPSSLPLNEGKSWEWNVMLPLDGIPIGRSNRFGIGTAFGFGRTTYKFANTRCFLKDNDRNTVFATPEGGWAETWLQYWTLRLPVMLEYSTSHDGFFIGVGPELEYRLSGSSLGRTDGMKKSEVITKDLDFHPLGVNLLAQVGFGGISFMARASLTELFAHSTPATEVMPISFVFGVGF